MSQHMPIKPSTAFPEAVIFDLDGLMIDTERLDWEASNAIAAARGFELDDEFLRQTIGRRLVDIAPNFERRFGSAMKWQTFAEEVAHRRDEYIERHGIPWKPGVAELLDHLDARHIPRALATSAIRDEALARMGSLSERMHAAAFGDEVRSGKPAPDIYLLAIERLGIQADRCIALEDSLYGVEAAQRAGLTVIMVPDLVPPHAGIRYICRSLLDVRDWLAT